MDRKEKCRQLLGSSNALIEAMRLSASSSGENDVWKFGSYKTFLRKYMQIVQAAAQMNVNVSLMDGFDLTKIKGNMDTLAYEQKEMFDLAFSNTLVLKSILENEIGYAEDETQKLKDFIQGSLRKALFSPPDKELEVQNAFELLLLGRGLSKGIDYDRETGRVKTSGKESIPDFVFVPLDLSLEIKLLKSPQQSKAVIDEINADIRAYGTKYRRQIYVVYDLGNIRDDAEFKKDLETAAGVTVIVIKH